MRCWLGTVPADSRYTRPNRTLVSRLVMQTCCIGVLGDVRTESGFHTRVGLKLRADCLVGQSKKKFGKREINFLQVPLSDVSDCILLSTP